MSYPGSSPHPVGSWQQFTEQQYAGDPAAGGPGYDRWDRQVPPRRRTGLDVLRSILAAILLLLAGVGLVAAPVATWARDTVLDTDTFTDTLTPLASDPAIQDQVIALVEQQVIDSIDFVQLLGQQVPAEVASAIGEELNQQLRTAVTARVELIVRSDTFAQVWVLVVRSAHERIMPVLTGDSTTVAVDDSGAVILDLQPVVDLAVTAVQELPLPDQVREVLQPYLDQVPQIDTLVEIGQVDQLPQIRSALQLLDGIATWIWWVVGALAVVGLALAHRRLRAVAIVAGSVAVGWALVQLALSLLGDQVATQGDPVGPIFDLVIASLVTLLWILVVSAVVLAVLAAVGAGLLSRRRRTV